MIRGGGFIPRRTFGSLLVTEQLYRILGRFLLFLSEKTGPSPAETAPVHFGQGKLLFAVGILMNVTFWGYYKRLLQNLGFEGATA
jgi:hypothetical protein